MSEKWMRYGFTLFTGIIVYVFTGFLHSDAGSRNSDLPSDHELTIETDRRPVTLSIELAYTRSEQRQGLKNRNELGPDSGMLFVFEEPQTTSLWMVDTYIPLDMIFIDARGVITRIVERTTPLSDTPILSGEPVRAVLEVNGGTSARLGIRPGNRVIHPAMGE